MKKIFTLAIMTFSFSVAIAQEQPTTEQAKATSEKAEKKCCKQKNKDQKSCDVKDADKKSCDDKKKSKKSCCKKKKSE